jgi:hypothetical protein
VAVPYPGSALYDEALAAGLLDEASCHLATYHAPDCKIRTNELSNQELSNYAVIGINLLLTLAANKNVH